MLDMLILIGIAAVIVTVASHLISSYRKAEGTRWQRFLAGARSSATIMWGYITATASMLIVWADQAAAYFALPEVQGFIKEHMTPTRIGIAMTVIAIITVIARLRTLQTR